MRLSHALVACTGLALGASGCSGLDLTICGTAEWDANSRGADTSTNRTVTVDFTTEKRFADAAALFDSVELASATVEIAEIGAGNEATKVSGRVEVGPDDGSSKVLIAEYKDLAIAANGKLELVLSAEGKTLAQDLIKGGNHKFKAFITGSIDKAPAQVKLRAKFNVVAKVAGGGTKTDLGCVSFGLITDEPGASCTPNPCANGTCNLVAEVPTCTCNAGFSGIKCENEASNLCANVTCEAPLTCNPATGQCAIPADPCAAVDCEEGKTCVPTENGHMCVDEAPCGATCQDGFICNPVSNQCEPMNPAGCSQVGCTDGFRCDPGTDQCVPEADPCAEITCQNGGFCVPTTGQCECTSGHSGAFCENTDEVNACALCQCQGACANACGPTAICGGEMPPMEPCLICMQEACSTVCPTP